MHLAERRTHTANGQPILYFTFDDGLAADTPAVLAALAAHHALAAQGYLFHSLAGVAL